MNVSSHASGAVSPLILWTRTSRERSDRAFRATTEAPHDAAIAASSTTATDSSIFLIRAGASRCMASGPTIMARASRGLAAKTTPPQPPRQRRCQHHGCRVGSVNTTSRPRQYSTSRRPASHPSQSALPKRDQAGLLVAKPHPSPPLHDAGRVRGQQPGTPGRRCTRSCRRRRSGASGASDVKSG